MPGGISIHVVDVAHGRVAEGLRVRVERLATQPGDAPSRRLIIDAAVGPRGTVVALDTLADAFTRGVYEVTFQVGEWYRGRDTALPDPPFLEEVPYRFGIGDPAQHYHLPMKITPWGFSCFRGGA